ARCDQHGSHRLRGPTGGRRAINPAPPATCASWPGGHDGERQLKFVLDIPTLDLVGQGSDMPGATLEMRMHRKRLAIGLKCVPVVADFLENRAKPGERTEMPGFLGEHVHNV